MAFEHVSYYGKARRSGTAIRVLHAPQVEYGQHSQRRVSARHNRGNAMPDQEAACQGLRRDGVEWLASWA